MNRSAAFSTGWLVCAMAVLWLGLAMGIARAEETLPTFALADMPGDDLSKDGWSDPQTEGDRKFRAAKKDGQRSLNVKAWWNEKDLRPPEGTTYVLEVVFKDVAAAPAIFYSHGALERNYGKSELHRFGGAADGQWKTACVPVSRDYLCRILETRDKTAFAVTPPEDLPIATVKVRLATAGDAERYFTETRAWIAKGQEDMAKAHPLAVEPPKFSRQRGPAVVDGGRQLGPIERQLGPVVAFPWPTLVPLLQNAQPKTEQIGAPVKVRMCLNDMEGGSFGVYANDADLKNVDYTVSELAGPGGALKASVVRRTAEYCFVAPRDKARQSFPQRLWPAYPVDIPKGQCHWFLFNVQTQRGQTQPGIYNGEIAISSGQGQAKLPLEVEVLPVDLLTMEEAGLVMGGCMNGFVPVSDIEFQVAYNQNVANIWFAGAQPKMTRKSGTLELDFTYLDDWMKGAKKRGVQAVVWFLGGNPYGWPDRMTVLRDLARIDTTGAENDRVRQEWVKKQAAPENREKVLPEVREVFKEWVKKTAEHAKQEGWPEIILTPFDEPVKWARSRKLDTKYPGAIGSGPWIKPFFKDMCAAIKEASPQTRIYASIHHNHEGQEEGTVFLPDVDVFCTNAIHEDPKLGNKVRAGKKTFWQYSSIGVPDAGAAGIPDQARYTFGFYFGAFDSRGSLAWAYNFGRGFDTTEGANWMYAWQTPVGTIPAPWFEGLREAWDDRRIIETYKKAFAADADAMKALDDVFKAAASSRGKGGRDTVSDFWAAVDDLGKLDEWRNKLLDRLAKKK